jgi:hypothetical protein
MSRDLIHDRVSADGVMGGSDRHDVGGLIPNFASVRW